jgi:hypothetical protein
MIKIFKIRTPKAALVIVLIGCLVFSYFKWALYISNDANDILNELESEGYINKELTDGITQLGEPGIEFALAILRSNDINESYVIYFGEYIRADYQKPTVMTYLTKPTHMFNIVKEINKEGRWVIGENSNNAVTGIILWLVWFGEFLIICAPAIAVAMMRANHPFIEADNNWAEKYNGNLLLLSNEAEQYKEFLKTSPNKLLDVPSLRDIPETDWYCQVEFLHSSDFEENYLTVNNMKYDSKSKKHTASTIVNKVPVNKGFLTELFLHCGVNPPFDINNFEHQKSNQDNIIQQSLDLETPLNQNETSGDMMGVGVKKNRPVLQHSKYDEHQSQGIEEKTNEEYEDDVGNEWKI